jgi:hypothetical protein
MLIRIGFILVALGAVTVDSDSPLISLVLASIGACLMYIGTKEAEHDEA